MSFADSVIAEADLLDPRGTDGCAPPDGLLVAWESPDFADVLAAAHRYWLCRHGMDLPGQGEWRYAADCGTRADGETAETSLSEQSPAGPSAAGDSMPEGDLLQASTISGHIMIPPGPALAGWLASAERRELDDAALVNTITGWRKLTSWAQAQELAAVTELARRRRVQWAEGQADGEAPPGSVPSAADGRQQPPVAGGDADRDAAFAGLRRELEAEFAPNEVALALTLTRHGAEYWMDLGVSLASRLPRTLAALSEGRIDLSRAKLIDQYSRPLSADLAHRVEDKVLGEAELQTSGQLRAALQRAVISVDPDAAERRRLEAEKNATVELFSDDDGTASLGGRFLPAGQAAAAWARICAMAKAMQSAGAGGGVDLLRAQVFVGLLLGTLPLIPPADDPGDGGSADGGPDDEGGPADGGPDADGGSGGGGSGGGPDGPGGRGPGGVGLAENRPEASGAGGCCHRHPVPQGGRRDGRGAGGDCSSGGSEAGRSETDAPTGSGRGPGGREGGCGSAPISRSARSARAGPSAGSSSPPAWPPIPPPGHIPTPGCAQGWPGDPQGLGQRDALARQAEGGARNPSRDGSAALSVPWRTLAGLAREPGELSRIGPVTAEVARALASGAAADAACRWRLVLVGRAGSALAVTTVPKTWLTRRCRERPAPVAARSGPPGSDTGSGAAGSATAKSMTPGPVTAGPVAGSPAAGPTMIARVTLTLPVATLDWLEEQDVTDWTCEPGLRPVLVAAMRAARRARQLLRAPQPPGSIPAEGAGPEAADSVAVNSVAVNSDTAGLAAAGLAAAGPATVSLVTADPCSHRDAVAAYRVPGWMRALVETRDQTCRFPRCRQPAWRCDQDHTLAYERGGPTCPCNLGPACRHHHQLKQLPGWLLTQARPGVLTWRTPAGLTYTVTPDPYPA